MANATYTVEASTEFGAGTGVNGYGKRAKVTGFYVVNRNGRRCRAFTGKDAEQKAKNWASYLTENM